MKPIKVNITQPLTLAEKFFAEKSLELLNKDSIDRVL